MSGIRKEKMDLLRGTLDLMILRTLELQPLHGIAISDRIRQATHGAFHIQAGSLFPALHRLEQEGWIAGVWTTNEKARRIKSYKLTSTGKKQLTAEKRVWDRIVTAVTQVLEA
jgi:PadR family transcriptional regulator PadR